MNNAEKELLSFADATNAKNLARFFKTAKGEYGYGDVFVGIKVPQIRAVAKKYQNLTLPEIHFFFSHKVHEYRTFAVVVLVLKYKKCKNEESKKEIFDFYIKNREFLNNWDLVDISTPSIVGDYLLEKERILLYELANSKELFERRIAILATFAFIKNGEIEETLKVSKILLKDKEDLIQKAFGWMLREAWKKSPIEVENFIKENYSVFPRTALRYAIEKMSPAKREIFLKGNF